jgi:hypothetical protein
VPSLLARLAHERRALGLGVFGLPLLVVGVFVGVAVLAAFDARQSGASDARIHHDSALVLLVLLEAGLPPVAGFLAAYVATINPAKELHCSLPVSYAAVTRWRLASVSCWAMLVAAGTTVATVAAGYWIAPQSTPLLHLTWLAPLLWFVGAGAVLALLLGSWVASSAALGMLWIGVFLFRGFFLTDAGRQRIYLFLTSATDPSTTAPDASVWLSNRLTLLVMALVFLAATSLLLRRSQAILSHEG